MSKRTVVVRCVLKLTKSLISKSRFWFQLQPFTCLCNRVTCQT